MKDETKSQLRDAVAHLVKGIQYIELIDEDDLDDETARAISKVKTGYSWLRKFL
ncbi:MAG: hypothetical protein J3T61_00330 [Candidatus Brocadiales bacterium]|nr:hypothetical protein [Candidatus Bathyanammoxibius sp.]